ncbi:hypothetical protein MY11210_002394 [Beauveria gryllotalpidicola]
MNLNREDDTSLSLAEHALQCITAFHKYLAAPRTRDKLIVMNRKKACFTRWALVMEVFGPPEVSLDYRLRDSPAMVDKIHQLFDVILHTLTLKPASSAHPLPSAGPPTTKKRRLSESGRAEGAREFDCSSKTDVGGHEGEINLAQMVFTIGGTVLHLWRLSYEIRLSADSVEAGALKPSCLAYMAQSNHKQSTRGHRSCSI